MHVTIYCHVSGVCVTNKRFLDLMIEFIGLLYNRVEQFTSHYLTHCHLLPTGHSTGTILTSNWTVNSSQSHIATGGQSFSLGVEPHLGLMTRYLFNCQLLLSSRRVGPQHRKHIRCIALDCPLLLGACVTETCLPTRSLTMGLDVTIS
jgi:hypothetical protein